MENIETELKDVEEKQPETVENSTNIEAPEEEPAPIEKKKKPRSQKQIDSLNKARIIRQEKLKLKVQQDAKQKEDRLNEYEELKKRVTEQEQEIAKLKLLENNKTSKEVDNPSSDESEEEEEVVVKKVKKKKVKKSEPIDIPVEKKVEPSPEEERQQLNRVASKLSSLDYMRMLGF